MTKEQIIEKARKHLAQMAPHVRARESGQLIGLLLDVCTADEDTPRLTQVVREYLANLGHLLRTQDNRITAHPMFAVQQKVIDYGYDEEYGDVYEWINPAEDFREADPVEHTELDRKDDNCEPIGSWRKLYYKERWEFVTACFTEKGCKDYIKANGYNLKEPRIYVYSGYRNQEWIYLREAMQAQADEQHNPSPAKPK